MAACGITEGTYYAPKLQISKHTDVPAYKTADANTRLQEVFGLKLQNQI